MSMKTRPMTADEFLLMPDDGLRHELIRGEVTTMSLPGGRHGEITLEIARRIANHAKPNKLGKTYAAETGFVIERGPDTVRGPDVGFVRRERLSQITKPDKYVPFAPDLAVEVLSPNDRPAEVREKVDSWLAAGTLVVWVVDPAKRILTLHSRSSADRTLTSEETVDGGEILPGFSCKVGDFFE